MEKVASEMSSAVAVVMCTFMGQTYLSQQLDSLLNQSRVPDRIYIYDDGSTDNTPRIIADYCCKYPDIICPLADGKHRGINGAVWYSLCQTREPMVFICDQDDIWHEDKIRRMTELAQQQPQWESLPCIVHGEAMLFQDGQETGKLLSQLIGRRVRQPGVEDLLTHNSVQGCTMLINRPLIRLFCRKRLDDQFPHCIYDQWMGLIAAQFGRIWFIKEPLVYYRIHGKNVVGSMQVNLYEKYGLSRNRKIGCDFLESFRELMPPEAVARMQFWIAKGFRKMRLKELPKLTAKGVMALCFGIKNL